MLKNYYEKLIQLLLINSYISGIVLLLIVIVYGIFIVYIVIIFLDTIYRPNITQYKKNIIFDIIIPIMVIIAPSIIFAFFLDIDFLEKFIYILLIHSFIVAPLVFLWSKHRNWSSLKSSKFFNSPQILFQIVVALIYPSLWFFCYNLLRYIRLNEGLNLSKIFNEKMFCFIIIMIFLWPFISIWIRLIIWKFLDIKKFFWYEYMLFLKQINIFLLRYNLYFYVMDFMWKVSFFFVSFISINGLLYPKKKYNLFQKGLNKLFFVPIYAYAFIFLSIIIEILTNGAILYYSLILLLIISIMRPIFFFLSEFNGPGNTWVIMCCYSDYKYLRWDNPRYPMHFWLLFNEMTASSEMPVIMSEKLFNDIQTKIVEIKKIKRKTINKDLRCIQRYYSSYPRTRFKNRLKLSYNNWTQVRWVHTSSKWHALTGFFAKNIFDKLALVNNNWSHFSIIEQLEKNKKNLTRFSELDIYKEYKICTPVNSTQGFRISKILEHNLLTNFSPLAQIKKYKIYNYQKNIIIETQGQAAPDIIFDARQSLDIDKRVHGLDQKATQSSHEPASKIFSEMSPEIYERTLHLFFQELQFNMQPNPQEIVRIQVALQKLSASCEELSVHQKIWSENVHLFPKNYIPPIRIPNNINTADFTESALLLFKKHQMRMSKVSHLLVSHNVPENDLQKAIEIFETADLQKLFGDSF